MEELRGGDGRPCLALCCDGVFSSSKIEPWVCRYVLFETLRRCTVLGGPWNERLDVPELRHMCQRFLQQLRNRSRLLLLPFLPACLGHK
jgi:hypothetical protein